MMILIHTQNMADLGPQLFHIIAVALLTELAEAAEVLTDLRRCEAELAAQLAGRYAAYACVRKLIELSEITRKAANNVVGYFYTLDIWESP